MEVTHDSMLPDKVAALFRGHAAVIAERDALRAQVAQLREALVEADRQMDIASTIGCIKAQRMVRAALAATEPGEEATR